MARIRSIHFNACGSNKLADLSDGAERLWWRMQGHCDDEGRLEDDPRLIRAAAVPLLDWSIELVDEYLTEMATAGLIVRYQADDHRVLQVVQWSTYQHPQKPRPSRWPAAPNGTKPHG